MKRFATLFVALGLATAGSTVLAEEVKDQVSKQDAKPQPVQMTDVQMDQVAAGQSLIEVDLRNIEILNNPDVQVFVPVNANAAVAAGVAVLGTAGAASFARQREIGNTQRLNN
jgi:hypothetical protein